MLFSLFSHQHILFPGQYSMKKLVSIISPRVWRGCLRCRPWVLWHTRVQAGVSCWQTLVVLMLERSYLINLFVFFLLSFCLSDTWIRQNLLTPKLCTKTRTELRMLFLFVICEFMCKQQLLLVSLRRGHRYLIIRSFLHMYTNTINIKCTLTFSILMAWGVNLPSTAMFLVQVRVISCHPITKAHICS